MRELGAVPAKDSVPPTAEGVKELSEWDDFSRHNMEELKRRLFAMSNDELAEVMEFIDGLKLE